MTRLAHRLALVAAFVSAGVSTAALSQTSPTSFITGAGVRNFPPAVYHADRQNWAVAEDNRGILYFGNSTGVLEFDGARWRRILLPGGRGAFALGKAADGRILVGGNGEVGWLAPDSSGSMAYVSKAADLPDAFRSAGDPVVHILDSPIGQVYLSDHWLFVRPATGALTILRSADHFLQATWFNDALYVLDSGRGLLRLDDGVLHDVAGGAHMRGLTMVVTGAGLLIPSYNDGLVLYSPGAPNAWTQQHVTGWNAEDNDDVTSAVALDPNLVALGTAKHGVALMDLEHGGLVRLGTAEGLADLHVYSVAYDHRGGLWLALDNGLSLVSLTLPRDSSAAPFNAWVRGVYGTNDERLLFGGAYFAVPGGVQQLAQAAAQELQFPYNYNAFRFEYSANGIQATSDMEFQTYVQGVDKDWSAWSSRTEREFTQLKPGKWVFRVRARKAGGAVSGEGVYELSITPAWYNTWWFLVFQVLFVLGALLLPGHAHHYKVLQEALTTFAVIVPFIYLGNWLGDFINHYYSTNIAFIQVLTSALLAFVLDPVQNYLKMHVQRRNERRRQRHLHRLASLQAESHQPENHQPESSQSE